MANFDNILIQSLSGANSAFWPMFGAAEQSGARGYNADPYSSGIMSQSLSGANSAFGRYYAGAEQDAGLAYRADPYASNILEGSLSGADSAAGEMFAQAGQSGRLAAEAGDGVGYGGNMDPGMLDYNDGMGSTSVSPLLNMLRGYGGFMV